METEWSIDTCAGVALVTVVVRNPSTVDRRVEVTNRLDGPVLPPRRDGTPEPGWDRDGFEGRVPPDGRLVLGYACPAPSVTPPVSVTDGGRPGEESAVTADEAVRRLGDPRPPADAVPVESSAARDDDGGDGTPDGRTDADLPPAVGSWLSGVEERIERGEGLTDASVAEATAVLERSEGVTDLEGRLAADAAALRRVADRTASLADRAEAVDVPVEALRRLA